MDTLPNFDSAWYSPNKKLSFTDEKHTAKHLYTVAQNDLVLLNYAGTDVFEARIEQVNNNNNNEISIIARVTNITKNMHNIKVSSAIRITISTRGVINCPGSIVVTLLDEEYGDNENIIMFPIINFHF
jgi:hypothetical protein